MPTLRGAGRNSRRGISPRRVGLRLTPDELATARTTSAAAIAAAGARRPDDVSRFSSVVVAPYVAILTEINLRKNYSCAPPSWTEPRLRCLAACACCESAEKSDSVS